MHNNDTLFLARYGQIGALRIYVFVSNIWGMMTICADCCYK